MLNRCYPWYCLAVNLEVLPVNLLWNGSKLTARQYQEQNAHNIIKYPFRLHRLFIKCKRRFFPHCLLAVLYTLLLYLNSSSSGMTVTRSFFRTLSYCSFQHERRVFEKKINNNILFFMLWQRSRIIPSVHEIKVLVVFIYTFRRENATKYIKDESISF